MTRIKQAGLLILTAVVVIQFIQPAKNRSVKVLSTDINNIYDIPLNVQVVLKASCYDCHSNNTSYPWYANIQPVGWLLANHVKKGKADLNFSEFGSYSPRKQINKLSAIENSIRDSDMPLFSYTLIHRAARLTKDNQALILNWVTRTKDSVTAKS